MEETLTATRLGTTGKLRLTLQSTNPCECLVADGDVVVTKVTVADGQQSARVVAFSDLEGAHTARQVEYWPIGYDPLAGREDLTRPISRVP